MLRLCTKGPRLCDRLSRREMLHVGALGALGLSMSSLRASSTGPSRGSARQARRCIILFLMGGPPQHSTWDPKPDAPNDVRGEIGPIATNVPGLHFGELMPQLAARADKLCVLRAVSTGDNAHSSSGYYMLTGRPHTPMNAENANPGAPNDFPSMGAIVRKLAGARGALPASVTVPHRIFNTNGSVW